MDPKRSHGHKIQAIKKHKKQQFLSNLLLYFFTTIVCTSFCSSPLWYPPFCATFNVFFVFSLPKICSFFVTSKVLFIVVNLIVIFLMGESKLFASKSKTLTRNHDLYYYKYESQVSELQISHKKPKKTKSKQERKVKSTMIIQPHAVEEKKFESYGDEEKKFESYGDEEELGFWRGEVSVKDEKEEGVEVDDELSLPPAEELNKLADDFIARVNRQRRLEAEFCRG